MPFSEHQRYVYELEPTSVVLDVGAYEGTFAREIVRRHNCRVYAFEPIARYRETLGSLPKANVQVFDFGVGGSDRSERISLSNDSSSIFAEHGIGDATASEEIEIKSLAHVLELLDLHYVDLLKLNVEGCEYEILEHILDRGLAERFGDIQVQFHDFAPDAAARRDAIRARLAATHRVTYEEPFVWENHERHQPRRQLALATMFRDEARYLEEWVEYNRMVGVEHFWLYDDQSSDDWRAVLDRQIEDGIVEVIDWPVGNRNDYMRRQVEAQRDAVERACGQTRWLALIDVDEYLLPSKDDTVAQCLERHYAGADAVYVNWRNFGTGGVHLERAGPTLFHLTASAEEFHSRNSVGKSIVRPEHVLADELWYPHHAVLRPGAHYYDGDGEPIPSGQSQPELDGKHHERLLRLNHYPLRDEASFRSVRLGEASRVVLDQEALQWEHYGAFSQEHDEAILDFIRERHPARYRALWGRPAEDWPMLGPYLSAHMLGRLGNNMFQIAAASAAAWDNGAEPVFPELNPDSEQYRHVLMRCNVAPDTVPWVDWREPSYAYSPIEYEPNRRLVGYFQSERYFAHHRERIRALFSPTPADATRVDERYGDLLERPDTVGVQLRYYRDEDAETYPQYGQQYLRLAAEQFPSSATFVLSSDNLDYARASVPAAMKNVVVLEGEPDYIDLFVLSACRHNIIGNSSFGWWAAWLNANPDKCVIRPARWVYGLPAQDVCPAEWLALEAPDD